VDILFFITLMFLLPAIKVYAYLDPGTGSFIFQILLAGFIGALFAVKLFWKRIGRLLKRIFPGKKKLEE
jgi:nitrate/nitrite transporter NarK